MLSPIRVIAVGCCLEGIARFLPSINERQHIEPA